MSRMIDLDRELLVAAAGTPFSAVRMLLALGASPRWLARSAGEFGTARVTLSGDGATFEPDGPTPRLLVAVRAGDGALIDIAALASHCRDEWALRIGDGWALGLDQLARAEQARDEAVAMAGAGKPPRPVRLRLFANPFDWMAADGAGLCVLEWNTAALTALRALGERVVLEIEPAAQERLRQLLAHGGLPRVEAARSQLVLAGVAA